MNIMVIIQVLLEKGSVKWLSGHKLYFLDVFFSYH